MNIVGKARTYIVTRGVYEDNNGFGDSMFTIEYDYDYNR